MSNSSSDSSSINGAVSLTYAGKAASLSQSLQSGCADGIMIWDEYLDACFLGARYSVL